MFFIDIPYALAQQEMIVLAQKSSETSRQADYGFRICKEVPYNMEDSRTAVRILAPAGALGAYLGNRSGQIIEASEFRNLTLLKAPIHGDLTPEKDYPGVFWYDPTYGYDGRDSAAFQVEYKGKIYRVVYDLFISRFVAEPSTLCPEPHLYKLKPVLNAIEFPGFTFSNLSAASVAQTTGTGSSAKITLDEDAAGHGWFIDYTPYLNEEWLPTSNPCEWQAKPGSDAEGKMDLLSVLLHEYGHVLGLEHTADAHDFMSTTLQPGVRRLPSASELQQMANLVAQLKGEMGLTSTTPQEPDTPLPYTPLPVSVGL
ncbi:MAG: matrixin family metalloprotease, partial [Candidatus Accumulibacter sp.]|nr:matrixin family metalloprotease [Accumulibacter sp.]